MKKLEIHSIVAKAKDTFNAYHRFAFLSSFFIGIFVHLFMFTNLLMNHDGNLRIVSLENMVGLGRWFLMFACYPSSVAYVPWVLGLLCVLYLSIASVLVCELFKIENKVYIFFISFILVAFPAVAATFSYLFTADGYMMAFMLSVLAVFLTTRFKWGFIPGGFFLLLALGTYQAYLAVACVLAVFVLLQKASSPLTTLKSFLQALLHYVYMGLIGLIGNFAVMQYLVRFRGVVLNNYRGLSQLNGSFFSIIGVAVSNIPKIYSLFFDSILHIPGFQTSGDAPMRTTLLLILYIVLLAAAFIIYLYKNKAFSAPWRLIAALFLLAVLPICFNISSLLSPYGVHLLMRLPIVFFYIALPVLLSKVLPAAEKANRAYAAKLCSGILLISICFQFFLTDNIAYANMNFRMDKMNSLSTRIADRIEQTEGFVPEIPVLYIGTPDVSYYPNQSPLDPLIHGMTGTTGNNTLDSYYVTYHYMKNFAHFNHPIPYEQMEKLFEDPRVAEMPVFPNAGATQVIDGIMIVKLSDGNPEGI